MASKTTRKEASESAKDMRYADWPECLPRYRWLVEDAVKFDDPERMFNVNRSTLSRKWDAICKVCGAGVMHRELREHLSDHVEDLKLSAAELSRKHRHAGLDESPSEGESSGISAEVEATIQDVLAGWHTDADGGSAVFFSTSPTELSSELVSAIVGDVEAQEWTEPPLCRECQLS